MRVPVKEAMGICKIVLAKRGPPLNCVSSH